MAKTIATIEQVTRIVERAFGIPGNILETKGVVFQRHADGRINYKPSYIPHRMIAMHFCRWYTHVDLRLIAKAFGNKEHSTVIHASKWVQTMIDVDDIVYATKIKRLETRLDKLFIKKAERDYEKKERKSQG